MPLIMHINYCEQGQSIEEACKVASDMGFDGIEFRFSDFANRYSVKEDEYLTLIKEYTDYFGLSHVIFSGPVKVISHDMNITKNEINNYLYFLDAAGKLFDLDMINLFIGPQLGKPGEQFGSEASEEWQWDIAAEACLKIGSYAPSVNFALETHHGYIHDLPKAAVRLIDMVGLPNIGINLDYVNMLYADLKTTMNEAVKICGSKTTYTHLKNVFVGAKTGELIPTSLGDGVVHTGEYLKLLKQEGFKGHICVESPRPGDRIRFAKQDIKYVKSLMGQLKS